ncbi:glycosyltransferase family 4 protein [Thermococcus sp.]
MSSEISVSYFGFWYKNVKYPQTIKWFFNVYNVLKSNITAKIFVHNKYLSNPYINTLFANMPIESYSRYLGMLSSKYDILHVITQWNNYWKVSKNSKAKGKILTFHDPFDRHGNMLPYTWNMVRYFDLIITPSHYTKKLLSEITGITENINVIYNSVDTSKFYPLPKVEREKLRMEFLRKFSISENSHLLLFVGTDKPSKNIEGLIQAVHVLNTEFLSNNEEAVLIKVGSNKRRNYIHLLANKLNVKLIFLENISDALLNILYNISDVYVHPSFREGFGMPLIEAMAAGVPVVASAVTSIPEICGDAALLFNPFSEVDMGYNIYKVLSRNSIRHKLIKNGLARVNNTFSGEYIAEQYLQLYTTVV